jgi:BirA family biotin operon repressor/biotin-[acetyl-CoA-carboxylase] ligase
MTSIEPARSPLEASALATAAGRAWSVSLLGSAASTNAVAAESPVAGSIVVADHQTAGRGRLDREWVTPAGSALTFSAVVEPGVADRHWPLLPLLAGVAVASGVRRATGTDVALKWPNDVLLNERKFCGILVERVAGPAGPLAVIGIGINVDLTEAELPVPTATSLAIEGVTVTRGELFGAVLASLTLLLDAFASSPQSVLAAYRPLCTTIGRTVDVHLPDGSVLTGEARRIDDQGRLVVHGPAGEQPVGAGDVVHVRPTER